MASRLRVRNWMRWVIRSRSSSSAASISGVASSGQYKIPGTFRHGRIRLIIRVGRTLQAGMPADEERAYLADVVETIEQATGSLGLFTMRGLTGPQFLQTVK